MRWAKLLVFSTGLALVNVAWECLFTHGWWRTVEISYFQVGALIGWEFFDSRNRWRSDAK